MSDTRQATGSSAVANVLGRSLNRAVRVAATAVDATLDECSNLLGVLQEAGIDTAEDEGRIEDIAGRTAAIEGMPANAETLEALAAISEQADELRATIRATIEHQQERATLCVELEARLGDCRDNSHKLRDLGINTAKVDEGIKALADRKAVFEGEHPDADTCREIAAIINDADELQVTIGDLIARATLCGLEKGTIGIDVANARSVIAGITEPAMRKDLDPLLAEAMRERDRVFALDDVDGLERDLKALKEKVDSVRSHAMKLSKLAERTGIARLEAPGWIERHQRLISGIGYSGYRAVLENALQQIRSGVSELDRAPDFRTLMTIIRDLSERQSALSNSANIIARDCNDIEYKLSLTATTVEKYKGDPSFRDIEEDYEDIIENLKLQLDGSNVNEAQSMARTSLKFVEACAQEAQSYAILKELDSWKADIDTMLTELGDAANRMREAGGADPEIEILRDGLSKLNTDRTELETIADRGQLAASVKKLHSEVSTQLRAATKLELDGKLKEDLDALVAAMSAETSRKDEIICQAAIEARFGVTLTVGQDVRTRRLPRMYALLLKVPETDTVTNKKLLAIEYATGPESSGNYHEATKIVFNAMPEDGRTQDYVPDAGSNGVAIYYDATTLHEVGHAVDDNEGFMEAHGGSAGYGQWRTETLDSVIEAHGNAGTFFNKYSGPGRKPTVADLKLYLRTLLTGGTPTRPSDSTALLGSLVDDWDAIAADATVERCAKSLCSAKPWNGGRAMAEQLAVGGRVYQESYPGTWTSYALGERAATGVSTYQWRAPGEWFAEIYALYYQGKLKSGHPMKPWLDAHTGTISTSP
ncbi:hypothetical protein [Arenibaculum pallidiluteum]|uniref:hypothetical protein n=1 Tax=Arenibaculum pallidiluteum TaxID=2812559 RepID=UPI001A95979B|nr:hypothetical protein [Arenibaculum pallidiluteum]